MRTQFILFCTIIFLVLCIRQAASELRCQCTTDKGGIQCHNGWCAVFNSGDKVGACAMIRIGAVQHFACARVSKESEDTCRVDRKDGRLVTRCWCRGSDYCNVDLAERVEDDSPAEESTEETDMVIDKQYDVNDQIGEVSEYDISGESDLTRLRSDSSRRGPVANQQPPPPPLPQRPMRPEKKVDDSIPPWRRESPMNGDVGGWKPPPPPPMPVMPVSMPSTSTAKISTTTTEAQRSYEEERKRYEEAMLRRREEHEREYKRREEERRKSEERRRVETQYESRRRFGEERSAYDRPQPKVVLPNRTFEPHSDEVEEDSVPSTSTTTTTQQPLPPSSSVRDNREKTTYESYYQHRKAYRRPFDLNPTQVSISSINAIVYPPGGLPTTTKQTTTTSATTTTKPTTTTTTASTTPRTTTTTTVTTTTTQSTTTTPTTTTTEEKEESMQEMSRESPEYVEDDVILPSTTTTTTSAPETTQSPKTSAEKLDEYRKLVQKPSAASTWTSLPVVILSMVFWIVL